MSVQIINVPDFEIVKQPEWDRDNWGADTAQLLYRGPASKKESFELTMMSKRWDSMPGFPNMRLSHVSSQIITPSFPGVVLHYIGLRDNKVPPVKAVNGSSIQSATGSGVDTATKQRVSGNITYKASRTTYTWLETSAPPNTPKYSVVIDPLDPFQNIIGYQIQNDDTGKPTNSIPLSSFVAVFNSLVKKMMVSSYEREPLIPDVLWGCTAEIDYKFIN